MNGKTATDILTAYKKSENGSEQLVQALIKQLIRTSNQLNPFDLMRVMQIFGQLLIDDQELFKNLEAQIKIHLKMMAHYAVVNSLETYTKLKRGTPEFIELLEHEILLRKGELEMENISSLFQIYANYHSGIHRYVDLRKKFVKELENILHERFNSLVSSCKDKDYNIAKAMWGMCKLDIDCNMKLWKLLLNEYQNSGWQINPKLDFFLPVISAYLKKNSLI